MAMQSWPRLEVTRQHATDHFADLVFSGWIDLDGEQFAGDADGGEMIGLDVNVGCAGVDGELQQAV
jgi:hypothetical protein